MGGSGGGNFSGASFIELENRILERLKGLAQSANRVLIACEEQDARALESHMRRSNLAVGEKIAVAIGPDAAPYIADISSIQLLVTFTDQATSAGFLNQLINAAFAASKQGIHARTHTEAMVPSNVLAYRWRSMSWDEAIALLM